jgi:SAM-dependent methyltransferase
MPGSADSKQRFSDRVADYVRHRPSYPAEVVDAVAEVTGLTHDWVVADIGSGTGLSCVPFLENGNAVIGVEPNASMRQSGDEFLAGYPRFRSVDGSAEATGLEDHAVDLVVAGQAFHWFDWAAARAECQRILREPPWAVLMWNLRDSEGEGFGSAYERLLERFGTDYRTVRASWANPEAVAGFFGGKPVDRSLPNPQLLDWEGLKGRHLSSSFVPKPDQATFEPMMSELRRIFDEHARGGRVVFGQDTRVIVGQLD